MALGQVTEDTALAPWRARSLGAQGRFDECDVVAWHVAWCLGGPPDVGGTTRRAFGRALPRQRPAVAVRASEPERPRAFRRGELDALAEQLLRR